MILKAVSRDGMKSEEKEIDGRKQQIGKQEITINRNMTQDRNDIKSGTMSNKKSKTNR